MTVNTATNRISTSGYCYDSPGNLLGQSNCTTYEYNAENQLVSTAGVTYTYDGDGKRVKSDQTSGSTYDRLYWYGLGLDTLFESDLSGNLTYEYVFFGGMRIARRTVSSGAVNYYVSDHLGTSRVVTDSSGSILDDCDFFPYGGPAPSCSSSSGNRYKFTGKERDAESGLDYFVARHYSSWMGRFMQPDDPFADQYVGDPQSWNLYSYVRNNPLNSTDPTGRREVSECHQERVSNRVGHKDDDGSYGYTVTTVCNVVWYPDPPPRTSGGADYGSIARGAASGGDGFFQQRALQEQRRSRTSKEVRTIFTGTPARSGASSCTADAWSNFALHAGVDAIGFVGAFLPGGTALSVGVNSIAAASGFGLAAMDSPGNPQAAGVGALMTTGSATLWRAGVAAERAALTVAKYAPVVGAGVSAVSMYRNWRQYQDAIDACAAGGN